MGGEVRPSLRLQIIVAHPNRAGDLEKRTTCPRLLQGRPANEIAFYKSATAILIGDKLFVCLITKVIRLSVKWWRRSADLCTAVSCIAAQLPFSRCPNQALFCCRVSAPRKYGRTCSPNMPCQQILPFSKYYHRDDFLHCGSGKSCHLWPHHEVVDSSALTHARIARYIQQCPSTRKLMLVFFFSAPA